MFLLPLWLPMRPLQVVRSGLVRLSIGNRLVNLYEGLGS